MGVEVPERGDAVNATVLMTGNGGDKSSNFLSVILSVIFTLFIAYSLGRRLLCNASSFGRRRHTLLLLGLCGSGKTTLFAQLVARKLISTRTSMQPNRASILTRSGQCTADGESPPVPMLGSSVVAVDFPGHRRLRESLTPELEEAQNVMFVVDSVMIHDDRHEGAQALAELVVSVLTSPAFFGVKNILVACTKRDELTSYSSKAVRKLLEAEITRCVMAGRSDVQRLDSIVNSAGVAIGRAANKGGRRSCNSATRVHELPLEESGKFTFDAFPVPVHFVDVSSVVDPSRHPFNIDPILKFIEECTSDTAK